MTRGRVLRRHAITREGVRANPDRLYVFGDNMARRGFGGQARAMRDEPNAVGIPTKWRPESTEGAYFSDADADNPKVRAAIELAFERIEAALAAGRDVVIPAAGLGTNRAELPTRAPAIYRMLEQRIAELEATVPEPPASIGDLAMMVRILARALGRANPESTLPGRASDYLRRKGLQGEILREDAYVE